jgi:hypothetical protein
VIDSLSIHILYVIFCHNRNKIEKLENIFLYELESRGNNGLQDFKTSKDITRLQQLGLQIFERLRKTPKDFKGLQQTSRDFK